MDEFAPVSFEKEGFHNNSLFDSIHPNWFSFENVIRLLTILSPEIDRQGRILFRYASSNVPGMLHRNSVKWAFLHHTFSKSRAPTLFLSWFNKIIVDIKN
jgi:hypothetical protein